METFPFAYECARKQGSLNNMTLPELVDCGKCAAEVINAGEKQFDINNSKSCGVCFKKIDDDQEQAPKAMNQFMGCCNNGIKQQMSQGNTQASIPPNPKPKPKPTSQPPPDQERHLTEPPLLPREDVYDQFEHDMLLPRQK
jgi:hypothetical protein